MRERTRRRETEIDKEVASRIKENRKRDRHYL